MKSSIVKLGFIGGGLNSAIGMTHKIASQMDNKFKIESGCFSRDNEINMATADSWGIASDRVYANWQDLLKRENNLLDAIVILTPTDLHTEIILKALEYKIPVICEKTLTTSVDEAKQIKVKLEQNKGFLLTTYNYTGYPMIRELKHLINTNKLGKIVQINIEMPQESFIRLNSDGIVPTPQKWRLHDGIISTLSLDLGTHLSNMIYFLTEEKPQGVIALKNSFGHYSDVTDNIMCMIKYSNNIDCRMWYSKSAIGHKNGLKVEIYGDMGSAEWYQMNPEFLIFNDNFGRNITLDRSSKDIAIANQERYNRFKSGHPAGFIEAFSNHYNDIYKAVLAYKNGKDYYSDYIFPIDSSLEGLKLMEALEKSTENYTWEKIND